MGKINVFNFLSINGYYKGPGGDLSWHKHGEEENDYSEKSLEPSNNILLFGRVTYEMMASYWPTPMATENSPVVAERMNKTQKIVFSRTLKNAGWSNTRLIKDNIIEEVKKLKQTSLGDMTILGSGSIVSLFANHGLIDEVQIMLDPVAIAGGAPFMKDISHQIDLALTGTKTFKSGVVLLNYTVQK
jgi:dihydrofolate reductase